MATIKCRHEAINYCEMSGNLLQMHWPELRMDDVGEPVELTLYKVLRVWVWGTFGAGGTCVLESARNASDSSLFQHFTSKGEALVFTSGHDSIQLDEVIRRFRPRVIAGDGATQLSVGVDIYSLNPR
jgi:hypothetical protein